MSTLYINEYESLSSADGNNVVDTPQEPPIFSQAITFTGTAGVSAPFRENTRFIAITADGIFSYKIGASPTATAADFRLTAGGLLYLGVTAGHKISAITNT